MLDDPQTIGYILGQMLAAQAMERIADHAVNIAEDVIYIIKGEDVRHLDQGDESNSDEPGL